MDDLRKQVEKLTPVPGDLIVLRGPRKFDSSIRSYLVQMHEKFPRVVFMYIEPGYDLDCIPYDSAKTMLELLVRKGPQPKTGEPPKTVEGGAEYEGGIE